MIKQHNPEPPSTEQVPRWLLSQLETNLYQGGLPTSRAAVVEALDALPRGVVGPFAALCRPVRLARGCSRRRSPACADPTR